MIYDNLDTPAEQYTMEKINELAKYKYPVDADMIPFIYAVNKFKGIQMEYNCCGHGSVPWFEIITNDFQSLNKFISKINTLAFRMAKPILQNPYPSWKVMANSGFIYDNRPYYDDNGLIVQCSFFNKHIMKHAKEFFDTVAEELNKDD
jgi:hypothetical protein